MGQPIRFKCKYCRSPRGCLAYAMPIRPFWNNLVAEAQAGDEDAQKIIKLEKFVVACEYMITHHERSAVIKVRQDED